MSTRWRIIDLTDYSGAIEVRRGRLIIAHTEIPLADIGTILTGNSTQWTGSFVELSAMYDIPIIPCDWRHVPIASMISWSDNSRIASRHQAQAQLSLPRKKNAWMRIIRAKIKGQASNLSHNPSAQHRIVELARNVRSGDPTNSEATAARTYWTHLFIEGPFTRNRNGDGRNILLNYGYTILRGTVIRNIAATGLAPALGIWHHNRSNSFALADDLIEPFRPSIDATVQHMDQHTSINDPGIKAQLVATLTQPMSEAGETVSTAIETLCRRFARYIEHETDTLDTPTWVHTNG